MPKQLQSTPSEARETPRISGAIVASLRAILTEKEKWAEVHAALVARCAPCADSIDQVEWSSWQDLESYVELISALSEVVDDRELRALGRERILRDVKSGFFSTILRSWLRSFPQAPENLLRIGPYLWRAGFRDVGTLEVASEGEGFMRLRAAGVPDLLRDATAWHELLAGMFEGLLEVSNRAGTVQVGPAVDDDTALDFLCMWDPS